MTGQSIWALRALLLLAFCSVITTAALAEDVGGRVLFQGGRVPPGAWHGKGAVAHGELLRLSGWRFQDAGRVLWQTPSSFGWHAVTQSSNAKRRTNRPGQARKKPVLARNNGLLLNWVCIGVELDAYGRG